jgi:hypothetical protein
VVGLEEHLLLSFLFILVEGWRLRLRWREVEVEGERRFFRNRRGRERVESKEKRQPFRPIAAPPLLFSPVSLLPCLERHLSVAI